MEEERSPVKNAPGVAPGATISSVPETVSSDCDRTNPLPKFGSEIEP